MYMQFFIVLMRDCYNFWEMGILKIGEHHIDLKFPENGL